jgi:general secretion pathway protein G
LLDKSRNAFVKKEVPNKLKSFNILYSISLNMKQPLNKKNFRQQGFSLMELLIVMVILGLLASLVAPKLLKNIGKAEQGTARTQIEMFMVALDAYRLDVGRYPAQDEGLEALIKNPGSERWDGPYLKKNKIPNDPWNSPYIYRNPGEHTEIEILSLGADRQPGGDKENGDVGSWM